MITQTRTTRGSFRKALVESLEKIVASCSASTRSVASAKSTTQSRLSQEMVDAQQMRARSRYDWPSLDAGKRSGEWDKFMLSPETKFMFANMQETCYKTEEPIVEEVEEPASDLQRYETMETYASLAQDIDMFLETVAEVDSDSDSEEDFRLSGEVTGMEIDVLAMSNDAEVVAFKTIRTADTKRTNQELKLQRQESDFASVCSMEKPAEPLEPVAPPTPTPRAPLLCWNGSKWVPEKEPAASPEVEEESEEQTLSRTLTVESVESIKQFLYRDLYEKIRTEPASEPTSTPVLESSSESDSSDASRQPVEAQPDSVDSVRTSDDSVRISSGSAKSENYIQKMKRLRKRRKEESNIETCNQEFKVESKMSSLANYESSKRSSEQPEYYLRTLKSKAKKTEQMVESGRQSQHKAHAVSEPVVESKVETCDQQSKVESKMFSLSDYESSKRSQSSSEQPGYLRNTKSRAKKTERKVEKVKSGRRSRPLTRANTQRSQPKAEAVVESKVETSNQELKVESKLFSLADYEAQKRARVSTEKPGYLRATRKTDVRIAARKAAAERSLRRLALAKKPVKPLRTRPARGTRKTKRTVTRKPRA